MKKLYVSLVTSALLMLMCGSLAYAQRTVTGKVTDETGTALPGVNVLIKGTVTGTVTSINGTYSINVPGDNSVLVFSFIGYNTAEESVGGRSVVNLQMTASVETLSELVITGYATQEKKDITGSVASVKLNDLVALPASTPEAQLQGRVSGVNVISSGVPGASSNIRIRGYSSFGGINADGAAISQSSPLYIVDGVPTYDLTTFNSYDIESLTVLKDAGAASIYGARASNGVIVITTKKGTLTGKSRITYDTYYGVQDPGKGFTNLLDPQGMADLMWLALGNDGKPQTSTQYGSGATPVLPNYILPSGYSGPEGAGTPVDPALYNIDYNKGPLYQIVKANKKGTDWFKEVTRMAPIQIHNLAIAGGNAETGKYFIGFNYFNQQGIIRETYSKRFSVRANTEFNVKNKVRIGENMVVSYRTNPTTPGGPPQSAGTGFQNLREDNPISFSFREQPIIPVYDIMGNFAGSAGTDLGNGQNPVANQIRTRDNRAYDIRAFGNIYAEADLLKGLIGRTSFGGSIQMGSTRRYTYHTYENSENTPTDNLLETAFTQASWVWTNTLTYKKTFGSHNIQAVGGIEAVKRDIGKTLSAQRFTYFSSDPDYVTIDNGSSGQTTGGSPTTPSTLFSIFGRADYGFKDRYLLSATVRRDGSSKFGTANKYGVFPSITAAWRMGAESFMSGTSTWLSDLKIRAGWGTMGNENNVPSANQYTQYGGGVPNAYYDINGTNNGSTQGFIVTNLGELSTKWETNETTNVGVDASFFNGKLNVTLDFYKKVTKDLLFNPERPATYGLLTYAFTNIGQMTNKGIDLQVDYTKNTGEDWRYGLTGTLTIVRNTIDMISNDAQFFDYNSGEENRLGDRFVRNAVGHSLSSFYGYKVIGLFQSDDEVAGAPPQDGAAKGTFRYADTKTDNQITPDDRTFLGSPIPDFTYGLNVNVGYKNFDLAVFLYGSQGNEIMNFTKWWTDFPSNFSGAKSKDALYHSWTEQRPNAKTPMASYVAGTISTGKASNSYYMENGSYLRARNIQLSYTLPADVLSRLGLEKARIYIQGVNLFTITKYSGLNPELGGNDAGFGIDSGGYPTPKQYLLGLNVTL